MKMKDRNSKAELTRDIKFLEELAGDLEHGRAGDKARLDSLAEFEHGVLYAAAQVVRLHDELQVAADVLKQAGLAHADCSKLDDYDKESLREVNAISGMALTGLNE